MRLLLSFLLLLLSINFLQAQNSVGIGTTTPNASAQLDVTSTTKGMLPPRMTSAQRAAIASPATGLMVYETTSNAVWVYNGSSWIQLGSGGGSSQWLVNGTHIYNGNTGNVGIGTNTPSSKFHVAGNMLMDATNATLQLQTGGVDKGFMQLSGDNLRIGTNSSNSLAKMIIRTGGADRLFIDSIGQVGIGKAIPKFDLDVYGNARIQTTTPSGKSTLSLYANPYNGFDVYGPAGLVFFNWNSLGGGDYDYTAKFRMELMGGTAERLKLYHVDYDNQLVISKTGNVGINTSSPTEKLEVDGNVQVESGLPLLKLKKTSILASGEFGIEFNSSTNTNLARISHVNSGLGFAASGSSSYPMFLKSNGFLGLGTSDPQEKLHVQGNTILTGNNPTLQLQQFDVDKGFIQLNGNDFRIGTNSSNINGKFVVRTTAGDQFFVDNAGYVGIGVATNGAEARVHVGTGLDASLSSNGYLMLGNTSGLNLVFDNNEIMARDGGAISPLVLQNDGGTVRIGNVAVPAGYKFAINGKMICEELKVKLASSGWPDYVFDKKYKLPSLDEVEKFIQQFRHLPNIPSAAEVEKNGIEVGDMQKRMMEKIEELTLYIIGLKKEIELLKEKK